MKSFSFIHFVLLLVLMVAYQCAGAQDIVITVKGDTLKGKAKLISFGDMPKVQITPEGGQKMTFDLIATREIVLDGETYHPQKGPAKYAFMKLLKGGYLSLYAFQQPNQSMYDGRLLVKKDGSSVEVPNLTFKKTMRKFLDDCPSVAEKIEAGQYSKQEIDTIIDEYNSCMASMANFKKQTDTIAAGKTTSPAPVENALTTKWTAFQENVKRHSDFEGKADALEIIDDIGKKLSRSEKVPNFLVQGLRNTIKEPDLTSEMESLLSEIQKL